MSRQIDESSNKFGSRNIEMNLFKEAGNGDMVMSATPTTYGSAATTGVLTSYTVDIYCKDAEGNAHTWLNDTDNKFFAGKISAAMATAGGNSQGTITASPGTLDFTRGKCIVTVSGTSASYPAGNVITLTVAAPTILGYTLATVTNVNTIA